MRTRGGTCNICEYLVQSKTPSINSLTSPDQLFVSIYATQHHIISDALDRLMKSFSSGAESLLTPNQLIEASFYQELLKSFCQSTENSEDVLPCVLHQDQWCVPLEMMKQKLVKICQTHNFNSSINTTVIYLLVGKMVVKIDRRATPILICVC